MIPSIFINITNITINSLILNYSEMDSIKKNYIINIYFNYDGNFSKLVVV